MSKAEDLLDEYMLGHVYSYPDIDYKEVWIESCNGTRMAHCRFLLYDRKGNFSSEYPVSMEIDGNTSGCIDRIARNMALTAHSFNVTGVGGYGN